MSQTPPAPPAHDETALAKTTQNPVGDIVSVPFQFNFFNGGGLQDATMLNLNFQPAIPIHLSSSTTMLLRTIFPIYSIPGPDSTRFSGMGDVQIQTFFTPAKPGRLIWGIGPAFSLPTATTKPVQTGTWGGGGSAVFVLNEGPFVLGSLISQISPMHDAAGPPRTNLFTWQYFVNYNFGRGWAIASAPNITANWDEKREGQRWTIPYGVGISRTLVFHRQPMTLGMQYYYQAKRPENAGATDLRFVLSLIFPGGH